MNRFAYMNKEIYSRDNLEKFVKHRSMNRLGLPTADKSYRLYYHVNTKHGLMLLNYEVFHERFNRMIVKAKNHIL